MTGGVGVAPAAKAGAGGPPLGNGAIVKAERDRVAAAARAAASQPTPAAATAPAAAPFVAAASADLSPQDQYSAILGNEVALLGNAKAIVAWLSRRLAEPEAIAITVAPADVLADEGPRREAQAQGDRRGRPGDARPDDALRRARARAGGLPDDAGHPDARSRRACPRDDPEALSRLRQARE